MSIQKDCLYCTSKSLIEVLFQQGYALYPRWMCISCQSIHESIFTGYKQKEIHGVTISRYLSGISAQHYSMERLNESKIRPTTNHYIGINNPFKR